MDGSDADLTSLFASIRRSGTCIYYACLLVKQYYQSFGIFAKCYG